MEISLNNTIKSVPADMIVHTFSFTCDEIASPTNMKQVDNFAFIKTEAGGN